MNKEVLSFESVCVKPSGKGKLSYVNINLFRGEIIGILGLKGSGISRIMDVMEGRTRLSYGHVRLMNQVYHADSIAEARKKGVYCTGFESSLIQDMTISENFFVVRGQKSIFSMTSNNAMNQETTRILEQFEVNMNATDYIYQLTEMQHLYIEIIKAYVLNAKVIILYEKLKDYTQETLDKLRSILKKLRETGVSVIIAGSDYKRILENMDRIYVLVDGSVSRILYNGEYQVQDLYGFMIGHHYLNKIRMENKTSTAPAESLYRVENLTTENIKELSLSVRPGEIVGLLDYDFFCGKSLALALIGGMPHIDGDVYIRDKRIKNPSVSKLVKNGVGYISHATESALFNDMSVKDNVTVQIWGKTHRIKGFINDRVIAYVFSEIKGLLKEHDGNSQLSETTHEERVQIQLQKWMVANAKVLIVDHPILNSDILHGKKIYEFIQKMSRKGCASIIVSSNLNYLQSVCESIVLIKEGERIGSFTVNEFNGAPIKEQ